MTSFAIKRVMKDILKYEKNKEIFNKEGIYINFNTDNTNILGTENKPHYAILIGPRGGPLQGGFFPFKFWFKPNYPETAPKVEFNVNPALIEENPVCETDGVNVSFDNIPTLVFPAYIDETTLFPPALASVSIFQPDNVCPVV